MHKDKHILLICSGFYNHSYVEFLGYKVSVITDAIIPDKLLTKIPDYQYAYDQIDFTDLPLIEQIAMQIHQKLPVDLIFAFKERFMKIAVHLNNKLNTRHRLPSEECIELFENKFAMRQIIDTAGGFNVPYKICHDAQDVGAFFQHCKGPIILKPNKGSGSQGVSIVHSEKQIKEALQWFQSRNSYEKDAVSILAEKFVKGAEYSVEVFSSDGTHTAICFVKKFKDKQKFIGRGHVLPIDLPESLSEKIKKTVFDFLDVIQYQNGPSHTEIIIDKSQQIFIVESHPRLAGAGIGRKLIYLVFDIDLIDLWLKQQFVEDQEIPVRKETTKSVCILFKSPATSGVVDSLRGMEDIDKWETIIETGVLKTTKNYYSGLIDSASRYMYVIGKGAHPFQALRNTRKAIEKISFTVQ